jgi:hypothetical protein
LRRAGAGAAPTRGGDQDIDAVEDPRQPELELDIRVVVVVV